MDDITRFLTLVDRYSGLTGRTDSAISRSCFNDGKRVGEIRAGGDVGVRTLARAYQWLSDHWPQAHPWPSDIPRPPRTPAGDGGLPDRPRRRHAAPAAPSAADPAANGGARATK